MCIRDRWKDFSVQICWADRKLDTENFLWGLNRMILGFAKKVILADVFGLLISQISGNMSGGIDIITAWGMAFLYIDVYKRQVRRSQGRQTGKFPLHTTEYCADEEESCAAKWSDRLSD